TRGPEYFSRKPRVSLGRRLFIGSIVWSLLVLIGGSLGIYAVYHNQAIAEIDTEIDQTLISLSRALEFSEDGALEINEDRQPGSPEYYTPLSGWYWAAVGIDNKDQYPGDEQLSLSLFQESVPWPVDEIETVINDPGTIHRRNLTGPGDEPVRAAAQAQLRPEREDPIILFAAIDTTSANRGADRLTYLMIGAMTLLLAGVLPAMWLGLRVALRPLNKVEADIAAVREGEKSQLDDDYPQEVQELTEEVNKLLEHNRGVVERARTHVGNLAHALKTPIAVLQNEAKGESLLDDVVRRQTASMHSNVQHYLKRAQAAARAETLGVRSEINDPIDGLVRLLNRLFEEKGVAVEFDAEATYFIRMERQDFEEIMGNLMENACKWAKSRVEVSAEKSGADVFIHVDDDGPGLTPEERVAALKRGVRLDETAPGTGLGLSIVTDLAEMNSGAFELDSAPDLGGLRASLKVPSA
ncbi:MAG: ATP-binding protein, partial [Pseudomonadota bacterium]